MTRNLTAMRRLAAIVVVLACVNAAGCGGDDKGRGDVAPKAWAAEVCAALKPWRTAIGALTTSAQQQMSAAKNAGQAKTSLVKLLTGAQAASEQARVAVEKAGAPEVDNGRSIAAEFTASLARSRDAYGRAKASVEALPTRDDKAFYDGVQAAFTTLNSEYAATGADPSKVGSQALQQAFAEEPACR